METSKLQATGILYEVLGNQKFIAVPILRIKVIVRTGNGIKSILHGTDFCEKRKL